VRSPQPHPFQRLFDLGFDIWGAEVGMWNKHHFHINNLSFQVSLTAHEPPKLML
jgi:hypothetical protein